MRGNLHLRFSNKFLRLGMAFYVFITFCFYLFISKKIKALKIRGLYVKDVNLEIFTLCKKNMFLFFLNKVKKINHKNNINKLLVCNYIKIYYCNAKNYN